MDMNHKSILDEVRLLFPEAEQMAVELVRMPTETPPSDTRKAAAWAKNFLDRLPNAEVRIVCGQEPIHNVIAVVRGKGAGKRLLLNGHLDTFCLAGKEMWTMPPFGGTFKDGKLYGVGVADMKAGSVCMLMTFRFLAEHADQWNGELVLSLVGDEENGGKLGTGFLMEHEPLMRADAAIIADIGSSRVLRFGEKGRARFRFTATGRPGHGAHAHKTKNPVNLLIAALPDFERRLAAIPVNMPEAVEKAILAAREVSESFEGQGETETIRSVTTNIGIIKAGTVPNLVPATAEAIVDVRMPIGTHPEQAVQAAKETAAAFPGVDIQTMVTVEPMTSDPNHEIFDIVSRNSEEVWGKPCVRTFRIGGTDAKHTRRFGIPTVNCGLQGANMGAPDEYVELEDLHNALSIHILSALDFLA